MDLPSESRASSLHPELSSDSHYEGSRREDGKTTSETSNGERIPAASGSNLKVTRIAEGLEVDSKDMGDDVCYHLKGDNSTYFCVGGQLTEKATTNIEKDLNKPLKDATRCTGGKSTIPPSRKQLNSAEQTEHKKVLDKELQDPQPVKHTTPQISTTAKRKGRHSSNGHIPDSSVQNERQKQGNAFHGFLYQLKLLMLFLHRGVTQKYSFHLSTEMKEAKKFDDLVFEYTHEGKKMYRFLQAKHKLDESKSRITADSLLSPSGDFSLPKYLRSYQDIKREKLFEEGIIKDVIICTNIDFDMESLNYKKISVVEMKDKDDILYVKHTTKQPKLYKFSEHVTLLLKPCVVYQCSDDDIKDFFDHLVFAVNQPNEKELGEIIRSEIGKEFDFITTENVYNKFFQTMLSWFQGKERGTFLSYEEGKEFFEEARRGIPVWFGVRDPVASFVGRSEQLRSLHQLLQAEKPQTVVVSGLGGVGKTELTRKYIKEHSRTYGNKVIWIEAESCHQLAASFRRLACDKLGISAKNASGEEKEICSVVEDVYKFFSNGRSLFIFDNAEKYKSRDEYDHGIDRFSPNLPAGSNRPHVLITSRNQKWPSNMKLLLLDVFNEEEAVKFIEKSLGLETNAQKDDAKQLARTLQCLPLALQQAVAYIKVYDDKQKNLGLSFQINDYLQKFKEKADELLNYTFPEDSDNDYSKTVFTAWNVTLDAIKDRENGNEALEIIYIASYFASENIPTEMFYNIVNDETKLGSAVELLKQYSMINVEPPMLNLHRLVQQVIRMQLNEQSREIEVLGKALHLFKEELIVSKNVHHAISAWNYSTKYKELIRLHNPVSIFITNELINSARYQEAYDFGLKVSESLSDLPGDDPSVLVTLLTISNNMSVTLQKLGKYDIALQRCMHTYSVQKAILGANHYGTLSTKRIISAILAEKGDYNEALKCYEEVLGTAKIILPDNDRFILSTKQSISQVQICLGRSDVALPMLREINNIQEVVLGKDDPHTLNTKRSLATALSNLSKFDEALQLLQEICSIQEATLTENHPDILLIKCGIAGVLSETGKVREAERIYQGVIDCGKDVLGEHHPVVLCALRELANVLRMQGKYEKALEIFTEVIDKQRAALGPDHPDTLTTQFLIGNTLQHQMKYEDALCIYNEVLSKREVVLGKFHPDTLMAKRDIAVIFAEQKDFDEALRIFQEVFDIQKRELGTDHLHTLITESVIGMIFSEKKENERALKILQDVYSKLEKLFPNHPLIFTTKINIAIVLSNQKKYEEALIKIWGEVLSSQKFNSGEEHRSITLTKRNIPSLLLAQGKHAETLKFYQEISNSLADSLGPEHPETLEVRTTIASLMVVDDILAAVKNNDALRLQRLLDNGGNVNTKDEEDRTLLHFAVSNGNVNIVNILLQNRADVTLVTKKGNTPLHIAASKNNKEMVQVLLHHVSKSKLNEFINAKTTATGATSLHVAARNSSLEVTKCLLSHGAMYNIKNHEGETPFDVSNDRSVKRLLKLIELCFEDAREGNEMIIATLRALSSDEAVVVTNARDNQGRTLLQVSIVNKHENISNHLLEVLRTME